MNSQDTSAPRQLQILTVALKELRSGEIDAMAFSAQAQAQTTLLSTLPPRYGEVLLQLLTRLESSMAFSEESCSFSQGGLLENIDVWLEKARLQLAPAGTP